MAGDNIDRYDLERAEKLAEWRGGINTELRITNSQLKELRNDLARYVKDGKEMTMLLHSRIDKVEETANTRTDKVNDKVNVIQLKTAGIAGGVGILSAIVVILLKSILHI